MLSTLAFLAAIGLFCYIVLWCIRNDGSARPEDQAGLLHMRAGSDIEPRQGRAKRPVSNKRREARFSTEAAASAAAADERPTK